jgi:hypothetical protein
MPSDTPAASSPASPAAARRAPRPRPTVRTAAPAAPPPPAAAVPEPPVTLGPIPPLTIRARLVILRACRSEHQAYCANAPPGGGRVVECLAANAASLSPECRQTIVVMTR